MDLFGSDDEEKSKSVLTVEEAANGYYWAKDKFDDVILVYVNDYKGEVTVKDMTKEGTYASFGDITLLERVELPDNYEEKKTEKEVDSDEATFTRRKLNTLYAGIISAVSVTIFLALVLPEYLLLKFTFSGTNITLITNVVIMFITIGLWKWKIFAEEKVGPSVDYLDDMMEKFEDAGMTVEKLSEFEPIMVAIAEGVGSMDEDEIDSAADNIRKFFNTFQDVQDSEGLEVEDSNAEETLESWRGKNE